MVPVVVHWSVDSAKPQPAIVTLTSMWISATSIFIDKGKRKALQSLWKQTEAEDIFQTDYKGKVKTKEVRNLSKVNNKTKSIPTLQKECLLTKHHSLWQSYPYLPPAQCFSALNRGGYASDNRKCLPMLKSFIRDMNNMIPEPGFTPSSMGKHFHTFLN